MIGSVNNQIDLRGLPHILLNVLSTYLIVFVNKLLFRNGFDLVCTLTGVHLGFTTIFGFLRAGGNFHVEISSVEGLFYALFFSVSVIGFNFSLLYNDVSTYQLLKLFVLPLVAIMETMVFAKTFSVYTCSCLCLITLGGLLSILEDLSSSLNPLGIFAGISGAFATGAQTVFLKVLQRKHNSDREDCGQLIASLSAWSSALILIAAPSVDTVTGGISFKAYAKAIFELVAGSSPSLSWLVVCSCAAAVLVNVSQYLIIGRFSAMTFQVVGQVKNFGILWIAAMFLGEKMSLL